MARRRRLPPLHTKWSYRHTIQLGRTARDICLPFGVAALGSPDGVRRVSDALHEHPAPDALDTAYENIANFMNFSSDSPQPGRVFDKI